MECSAFDGENAKVRTVAGMSIWDRGTYESLEWAKRKIEDVLRATTAHRRYVLFATNDKHWMIHRIDPGPEGYEPLPDLIRPMMAVLHDDLPTYTSKWGFELKWDGVRAVVYVQGGRPRVMSRGDL